MAGYSYCSGLTTTGLYGCPMCHDDVYSKYIKDLKKTIFGRHRRFLPRNHLMRNDQDHWYGAIERDGPPIWPNGDDWLNRWEEVEGGMIHQKQSGMRRLAIWYELPYFQVFLVILLIYKVGQVCTSFLEPFYNNNNTSS